MSPPEEFLILEFQFSLLQQPWNIFNTSIIFSGNQLGVISPQLSGSIGLELHQTRAYQRIFCIGESH